MRKAAPRPFGHAGYGVRGRGQARSAGRSHRTVPGDLFDVDSEQWSLARATKWSTQCHRADAVLQPANRTACRGQNPSAHPSGARPAAGAASSHYRSEHTASRASSRHPSSLPQEQKVTILAAV